MAHPTGRLDEIREELEELVVGGGAVAPAPAVAVPLPAALRHRPIPELDELIDARGEKRCDGSGSGGADEE
nr:hypothetical protein Iba_chr08dCG14080 [Ipomoea batatas]GMD28725.1 hypothetical protein Iba_chr08eCG10020 [Ipomoea batatas]